MTSEIKADKWSPASGTAGTIGDSGDTFTLTAGANLTLGGSSTTVTVPSGATLDVASGATADFTGATVTGLTNAFTLIKTENVTSSTSVVNVTNCFSTTYDTYLVLIYRLLPVTDSEDLRMRFLVGGSEVSDTGYDFASRYFDQDGALSSNTGNNGTKFVLADSIDNLQGSGGFNATLWFNLDKNTSAGNTGSYTGTAQFADGSGINHSSYMAGYYQDSTSVQSPTGLKFFGGSGNITSVKISVYGVTK